MAANKIQEFDFTLYAFHLFLKGKRFRLSSEI